MIPTALFEFVNKLNDATERDAIEWESIGSAGTGFSCSNGSQTLFLTRGYVEEWEQHYYQFAIVGKAEADFRVDRVDHPHFEIMRNLFSAVQVNAGGLSDIGEEFFRPTGSPQ